MRGGRVLACVVVVIGLWAGGYPAAVLGVNGVVLDQQLDANRRGYSVVRLWGSYYEMGCAHATLFAEDIVTTIEEGRIYLGPWGETLRAVMAEAVWIPQIESELQGMVDALAESHPSANIDVLDLKVLNTQSDWGYACRSHTCWGRYVAEPVKTLSTRRLDYRTDESFSVANHHVLFARQPTDGSPLWVGFSVPGYVHGTSVNEFGTLVSLHDFNSPGANISAGRMARSVAGRLAVTFTSDPDVSTHAAAVYNELRAYNIMTGTFLNFYAPEGHGGVLACRLDRTPNFYHLRTPQAVWHHGEAMITTNSWTDGTYTPADENFGADTYYSNESPKTQESHWDLLADAKPDNMHMLSVAYRNRRDMTVWGDGRLDGVGRTPRIEWEWSDLFNCAADLDFDGDVDGFDFLTFSNCFNGSVKPAAEDCENRLADLDGDLDVDGFDFLTFSNCFNGSNRAARCP